MYVRTFSGKTISIMCGRRQETNKIKEEVEGKTKILKEQQRLVCQGKTLKDGMCIGECSMKEDTAIEMTLRLQGGMKTDDSMTSAGIAEG